MASALTIIDEIGAGTLLVPHQVPPADTLKAGAATHRPFFVERAVARPGWLALIVVARDAAPDKLARKGVPPCLAC